MAQFQSAGYSGTPLSKKLGIRAGSRVKLFNPPEGLSDFLRAQEPALQIADGELDVAILFVSRESDLRAHLPEVSSVIKRDGGLWICWPKKASKLPTDITEDILRANILPTGLVDVKVCAVSEVWSGLRFVRRRELR